MKVSTMLSFFSFTSCLLVLVNSFAVSELNANSCPSSLKASPDNESSQERPSLVSQSSFMAAIETIEREVAIANGVEYVKEEGDNISYAIGR